MGGVGHHLRHGSPYRLAVLCIGGSVIHCPRHAYPALAISLASKVQHAVLFRESDERSMDIVREDRPRKDSGERHAGFANPWCSTA